MLASGGLWRAFLLERALAGFQRRQFSLQRRRIHPIFDCLNNGADLPVDPGNLGFGGLTLGSALSGQAFEFAVIPFSMPLA
ncbi:MAG: hypothetical protein ABI439_12940 [Rhodospirillales bacterium]